MRTGIQHSLVLRYTGDEVVAFAGIGFEHALEGQVIAFRSACGKNNFSGVGADQFRHLLAGDFDAFIGRPAESVLAARGIAELLPEIGQHGFQHPGVDRRGSVVVKIDRELGHLRFSV